MCGLLRVLEKRKDPGRVRARLRDSCPGVVFLVWGNPEVYAERKTLRKDTKTARVCRAVSVVSLLERSLLDEHARERREGRLDFGAHVDQFRSLGIVAKWCLFGTDRLFVRVREKKRKVRGGREFARRRKIRTLSVREENSNEKSRSHENCGSEFWRKERDSNPRYGISVCRLSRAVQSTTLPSFHFDGAPPKGRSRREVVLCLSFRKKARVLLKKFRLVYTFRFSH